MGDGPLSGVAMRPGLPSTEAGSLRGRVDAVVIGASAGGVEALLVLLPVLPKRLAAPVVVVVHLPRDRPSLLVKVFAERCVVPVREVDDKQPVEPGTVYFAPPDYHVLIDAGPSLALSADEAVHYSRPSIDVLFDSAADVYRNRLAGLILSGANSDGADGLAAIERVGGVTIVQDPQSALASAMPSAALRRVAADHVLNLDGIAAMLRTLDTR